MPNPMEQVLNRVRQILSPVSNNASNAMSSARESYSSTKSFAQQGIQRIKSTPTSDFALFSPGMLRMGANAGQNIQNQVFNPLQQMPQTQNTRLDDVGRTIGNFGFNFTNLVGGAAKDISAYQNIRERPIQATAQVARGLGKSALIGSPLFQSASAISSLDTKSGGQDIIRRVTGGFAQGISQDDRIGTNVPSQNINLPFVGEVDPIKAVGGMVGFVKNPTNKGLFSITEKILPTTTSTVTKWLTKTATRGGLEDVILNLPELPENMTTEQKARWVSKNLLSGALSEIVGQGVLGGGNKGLRVATDSAPGRFTSKQLAKGFDELRELSRKLNTPVKTIEMGKDGLMKTMPMWQVMMKNQVGSVNNETPDIFKDAIKPGDVIDPKTGNVISKRDIAGATHKMPDGSIMQGDQHGTKTNLVEQIAESVTGKRLRVRPDRGSASIADLLVNKKFDTGTGYSVRGQEVGFEKMMSEGWKPNQIDYAVKLANEAKVSPDNVEGYVRGILKTQYPKQASRMGKPLPEAPSPDELAVMDRNASNILQSTDQTIQPSIKQPVSAVSQPLPEVKTVQVKPITQQIDEFATIHPKKDTVIGKPAEVAYRNLETGGQSIVDQVSADLKKTGVKEADFVRYVENPDITPANIRPAVDAHRKLVEVAHGLRENTQLGTVPNYFPHMTNEGLSSSSELRKLGDSLWVDDFTRELGSSQKRTGSLVDYSLHYNKVMKNYISQTAYDKYGKKIGMTPKTADFVAKVDGHLQTNADGLYAKPSADFNYVDESAIKNEVTTKVSVFSKVEPIDTFDSLRRKIVKEKGGKSLSDSMIQVRDVSDKIKGILLELKKADAKETTNILANNLVNVGKKTDVRKVINVITSNGKNKLSEKQIAVFLKAEKDFTTQGFVDEVGKYEFGKETKSYLNQEIDRMLKFSRYEGTLLDKAVNFVTGAFYRAQIWGNVNTGLAQKMEITRIPVMYSPNIIILGVKQRVSDIKNKVDILRRYDFSNMDTDVSKQLNVGRSKGLLSKIDEKAGNVGNLFVSIGENSKNRDFLYAAEAQGKTMGIKGQELKDFVRSEVFANGLILHEFATPKMLNNPLVRLALQYQQFNIKLLNIALELGGEKQYGKVAGLVGSQVASAAILFAITGKPILDGIMGRVIPGVGPAISLPIQIGTLLKEEYDSEEKGSKKDNSPRVNKLISRNTIPFANQFFKTKDAKDVLDKGYNQSTKGNVTYVAGDPNLIEKGQALLFGKTSLPNARENSAAWNRMKSGKTSIYPALTADQSVILKSLPKEEQEAYYNEQLQGSMSNKERLQRGTAISPDTTSASTTTPLRSGVVEEEGSYYVQIGKEVKSFETPEDANEAVDRYTFKKSGKNIQEIGDSVFRRSKGGDVTIIPKIDYDTGINEQKMTSSKTKDDYKTWSELAMKQLDNYQQQMKEPSLDELEKATLQNKMDKLVEEAIKYHGYGAFTKGKKAKKPKKISVKMQTAKFGKSSFKMRRTSTKKSRIRTLASKKIAAPRVNVSRFKTRLKV